MSDKSKINIFFKGLGELDDGIINQDQKNLLDDISDNKIKVSKLLWYLEKGEINNGLNPDTQISNIKPTSFTDWGFAYPKGQSLNDVIEHGTMDLISNRIGLGKGFKK